MAAPPRSSSSSTSAVLLIDRDLLWRKLFALDQDSASAGDARWADELHAVVQRVVQQRRHGPLRAMVEQRVRYWLRADIAPPFWRFLEDMPALLADAARSPRRRQEVAFFCAEQLTLAMQFAEDAFAQCVELASVFDAGADAADPLQCVGGVRPRSLLLDELRVAFRSVLFEDRSRREAFEDVLLVFFSMSFHKFCGKQKFQAFDSRAIQELLQQLDWMHLAEPALRRVLQSQIQRALVETCGDDFTARHLAPLEDWAAAALLPWIHEMLRDADTRQRWSERLSRDVLRAFVSWRIEQLFDMIKEFPDRCVVALELELEKKQTDATERWGGGEQTNSTPALEDLRAALDRTQQHEELTQRFREVLVTRLLHPGANTSAILDIYVSTIKAFRFLDPRGVLLETLSEPVKEYLKQRKDTVRCIVTSLTDEENSDLFEELRRVDMRVIQQDDDSDDDEDISPDLWEPDPIDADPSKTTRSRSSDDILRILVNIYGSRELFVNEYRLMLADKLLQNTAYDTDRDVQTLELLKLRFGEESLQQAEIMVRDIDDSKRVNQNVRSTLQTPFAVDATIVSQHFWPPLQSEDFALHPHVAEHVEQYKRAYAVLKNPRTLVWNNSLGSVELAVELDGVERDFKATPLQATILQFFDGRDDWNVEELAAELEISSDLLLRHATFWLNHGLLSLSGDRTQLSASRSFDDALPGGDAGALMLDDAGTAVSSQAQEDEDVRTLETYIVGMLSNFGSLSMQRIHNTLSTFARSGVQPYDKTISGLSVILAKLVAQGRLEVVGGQYQLAK
ncbi:hypothetical protein P43SY_007792 [Pythium insidiosum]|uniref:Anaphase-promoting complex subunit 2 n=1 Tax=Pythium insidiosum TaxID=114742 RepID=A0AAD5Q6V9_PYTIN|nr:hypothetical protein P43SY_007792 [Pythium insidiosum]